VEAVRTLPKTSPLSSSPSGFEANHCQAIPPSAHPPHPLLIPQTPGSGGLYSKSLIPPAPNS